MNGNDDFFGGSINPAPVPNPGTMRETNVYAPPGSPAATVRPTSSPTIAVIVIVVGVLVATATFVGYGAMTSGTQIEIPQTLMGMERMDSDSPLAQQVEATMSASSDVWGDVDLEVGVFQAGEKVLLVLASEDGADSLAGGTDDYFAGYEDGFNQSGAPGTPATADPGPRGGEMRCITLPSGGTCAWSSDDTFGVFAMSPMDADPALIAQQIRDTIEN